MFRPFSKYVMVSAALKNVCQSQYSRVFESVCSCSVTLILELETCQLQILLFRRPLVDSGLAKNPCLLAIYLAHFSFSHISEADMTCHKFGYILHSAATLNLWTQYL